MAESLFGRQTPVRIGRFVLKGLIGAGAMGAVYEAHDEELGRAVAVKLLHDPTDDAHAETTGGTNGSGRLLREARALARLSHPNVVTVHEVGRHEEHVFLAMELIRGQTLHEWVDEHAHDVPRAIEVLRQAGLGLAAAHRAGLIHRDFKPSNVMIDESDHAVVLDFGLAVEPELPDGALPTVPGDLLPPTLHTRTGSMAGTPPYMAPERLLGTQADRRCDQYAFAVTAWEVLFGQRPYLGATVAELVTAASSGPPGRPRGSRVPRRVVDALRRALEPEPSRRWACMDEMLDRMTAPRASRRRVVAVAAIGLGLAGLGVLGFGARNGSGAVISDEIRSVAQAQGTPDAAEDPIVEATHQALVARDRDRVADGLQRLYAAGRAGDVTAMAQACYLTPHGRPTQVPRATR